MITNKCDNCDTSISEDIDACRQCIKRVEVLGTKQIVVRINDLNTMGVKQK